MYFKKEKIATITSEEKDILHKNFPHGIVSLDFETTGLSPIGDKIIEIAAIKVTKDETLFFETLINPQRPIPQETTLIHQITDEMVSNSPVIEDVLPSFLEFISDHTLLGHNAKFDVGFLVCSMYKMDLKPKKLDVYCSCLLAREVFPEAINHKLDTLCTYLSIPLKHHEALSDSIAGLMVFTKGLLKISSLTCSQEEKKKLLRKSFLFTLDSLTLKNAEIDLPKHLSLLSEFVKDQRPLEILYSGGTIKNVFRPVRPISILPMPGGLVLYALCLISNMHKSFVLTKIKELRKIQDKTSFI